jgi:putative ABC transport system permease protein
MASRDLYKYPLKNLKERKSRSLLTIISILFGITTIFIFISFGQGLYDYIDEMTSSSTANKIIIQAKGMGVPGTSDFRLSEDDLKVVDKTTGVYETTGVYMKPAEIMQRGNLRYVYLIGYDPSKPLIKELFNVEIIKGKDLKKRDTSKVVLGYNYLIEDKIFKKPYEINDRVEIQGEKLKVSGFYDSVGNPQDDSNIYVTENSLEKLYPDGNLSYAWIIAEVDMNNLEQIIEKVKDNLRDERNLEEGEEDFFIQSYQDMIESYTQALDIVVIFVILIALISIIVSAINTANTMITSILERFKEIGIMKAIGAKNSSIFKIFLFESSILGFIAGSLGVALGFVLTLLAKTILNSLGWGFLSPHYSPILFLGCIAFAVITGAISGVLPALKASKINPVDALRYE